MIIRSQDKRRITSDLNLSIKIESRIMSSCLKEEFPRQAMFRIFDSKDIPLGDYSTEEKAIKVLDMIQKEYGRHYYGEGGPLATMNHYVEPFAFIPPKVFQMPSDEEVEV